MKLRHRIIGLWLRSYWRWFKPRTVGVRAVVKDGTGRIALVRHTYLPQHYLPGGGVARGETMEMALRRELAEELGLANITIDGILGVYHNGREYKDDYITVFVCTCASPDRLAVTDKIEIAEAGWYPLESLPSGLSPATARRISDYRTGTPGADAW